MKIVFYIFMVFWLGLICRCHHVDIDRESALKTDLGPSNDLVAGRYEAYKKKPTHCRFMVHADYRVLLGSFGPFSGQQVNTSSLVAMNFGKMVNDPSAGLQHPQILDLDGDAAISESLVTINGKTVAVCAVNAAVVWDLAASIYVFEANIMKPDLIILSGMDGSQDRIGTWEHYARNLALGDYGYDRDGHRDGIKPQTNGTALIPIQPGGPAEVRMTWDGNAILAATASIVREGLPGFDLQTSPNENPGTYLCNNVSYAVLTALNGGKLFLAGGKMMIAADGLKDTHAGFFHYPWESPQDDRTVRLWTRVLAAAIGADLGF